MTSATFNQTIVYKVRETNAPNQKIWRRFMKKYLDE